MPNNATAIILVNPNDIITAFANDCFAKFHRVLIIYDSTNKDSLNKINQIINGIMSTNPSINNYRQNSNGTWEDNQRSN
jgi:hypothetical protein